MRAGLLKDFLRLTATVVLFGGPLLALFGIVGGLVGLSSQGVAGLAVGVTAGLTVLFWSLLLGGGLHLLLSIDDRRERLEGKL